MCLNFPAIADPEVPGIYWRDEDDWKPYTSATARAILKAASMGLDSVNLGSFTSDAHPSGATYELDLQTMKQKNPKTGQLRPVLTIPRMSLTELRTVDKNPSVVWKKIIDDFTTEAYMQQAVNQRATKCKSVVKHVRRNPNLTSESPIMKQFLETVKNLPADVALGGGVVDLAFHGTRASSFDPILRNGMCPTRRTSNPRGDWFTREVATAASYSRSRESGSWVGGTKVMAFLLIVLKDAVVHQSGHVVVLNHARYQLPLAEVTLE